MNRYPRQQITLSQYATGEWLTLRQFAAFRAHDGAKLRQVRGLADRGDIPAAIVTDAPSPFLVIPKETAKTFKFPKRGRPPASQRNRK